MNTVSLIVTLCVSAMQATSSPAKSLSVSVTMTGDHRARIVMRSAVKGTMELLPTVQLHNRTTGENYWSPFGLNGASLPLNGRVQLTQGTTVVEVDFVALKWARSRSAVWPSRNFEDVVADGDYEAMIKLSSAQSYADSNVVRTVVRRH